LIWDLEVEEALLKLGPGVCIRRLDGDISVFDLAAAGAAGFREWAMLEPFLARCTCEIEVEPAGATESAGSTLSKAWLASALMRLKGFGGHLPLASSAYSWNVVAGHQERTKGIFREELEERGVESAVNSPRRALPAFKGQLLDVHTSLLRPENVKRVLTKDDADWVSDNYERFNKLAGESEAFNFALASAVEWQYASSPRMAMAQLWSGIEALFGISSELVYRISLQVACLLEERGMTRRERFDKVKKLYEVRSKAVHGEELSFSRLYGAVVESFDILNRLLLASVEKGRLFTPDDINQAIFH
jgi:hypothetical protein